MLSPIVRRLFETHMVGNPPNTDSLTTGVIPVVSISDQRFFNYLFIIYYQMLSYVLVVICPFIVLVISYFGFEGRIVFVCMI